MHRTRGQQDERDDVYTDEARARVRELRKLSKTDVLGSFEGALELLDRLATRAAERAAGAREGDPSDAAPAARAVVRLIGRLLADDAAREKHEIDRETAWFQLFEIWLRD